MGTYRTWRTFWEIRWQALEGWHFYISRIVVWTDVFVKTLSRSPVPRSAFPSPFANLPRRGVVDFSNVVHHDSGCIEQTDKMMAIAGNVYRDSPSGYTWDCKAQHSRQQETIGLMNAGKS